MRVISSLVRHSMIIFTQIKSQQNEVIPQAGGEKYMPPSWGAAREKPSVSRIIKVGD